jgi:hypothetical protein
MITIDISSDLEQARGEVANFFRKQMRFVMMKSINDTARDVQTTLRSNVMPKATPRNAAFPRAATYIIPDEKSGIGGMFTTSNFLNQKDTVVIGPVKGRNGHTAGEGFMERQITGKTKTPRGSAIAIPNIGPGLKRNANGSIPAGKKAKNLRGNEKFFKKPGKGNTNLIFERMGADGERLKLRHILVPQAKGTRTYAAFYPEAYDTVNGSFPAHFQREMTKAIANSRFK